MDLKLLLKVAKIWDALITPAFFFSFQLPVTFKDDITEGNFRLIPVKATDFINSETILVLLHKLYF